MVDSLMNIEINKSVQDSEDAVEGLVNLSEMSRVLLADEAEEFVDVSLVHLCGVDARQDPDQVAENIVEFLVLDAIFIRVYLILVLFLFGFLVDS